MPFLRACFAVPFACVCLAAFGAGPADAGAKADALVKKGLEAEKRMEPKVALEFFRQADELRPNDAFVLQRISRQYSDATVQSTSDEEKARLLEQALIYSKKAYDLDPKNPVCVLSMAICYGKLGLQQDVGERVENARLIRKYAEEALALKPDYDWAHHVLGRWHYEVAELGGTKRLFARLFFGGLPKASLDEAVSHLRKAVELAPNTVSHRVELGFALKAAGKTEEARREFEKGLALPSLEIHDETAKARAREEMSRK